MSITPNPNAFREAAARAEVIYQVYPATFCDSNGDGHGDLQGIIQKVGYIKSLGVDAIWLSPIYPSPEGPEGDGGYAVNDRRDVDPRYGTLDDMKELIRVAHDHGLRIYMDDVLPHTSNLHEWFQISRNPSHPDHEKYKDFYVWHEGVTYDGSTGIKHPPNNWLSVFGGGAWEFDETRQQFYLHHFLDSQPALNLNNRAVQDAVLDDMKFWLDMGIDGFRFDSIPFANHDPEFGNNDLLFQGSRTWEEQRFTNSHCQPQTIELVARIRELADSYTDRDITTLGEVICGRDGGRNPMAVAEEYVDPKKGLTFCYTDAFRAITPDAGYHTILQTIRGLAHHFPHGGHCNAIGNHDSPRTVSDGMSQVPDHVLAEKGILKLLWSIKATLPGSMSIYQGEELRLPDARVPDELHPDQFKDPVAKTKGPQYSRDPARTPMPWHSSQKNAGFSSSDAPYLPVAQRHYDLSVNKQDQNPHSMLNDVRCLLAWRQQQPALIKGSMTVLNTHEPLIAYVRQCREQTLLCIHNMSNETVQIKPSDVLCAAEVLQDLGLTKEDVLKRLDVSEDEVMRLDPYHSQYRGAAPTYTNG